MGAAFISTVTVVARAPTAKDVLDVFLAPLTVAGAVLTGVSGVLAALALFINWGKPRFYETLQNNVNVGLAVGFTLSLPADIYVFIRALQSLSG